MHPPPDDCPRKVTNNWFIYLYSYCHNDLILWFLRAQNADLLIHVEIYAYRQIHRFVIQLLQMKYINIGWWSQVLWVSILGFICSRFTHDCLRKYLPGCLASSVRQNAFFRVCTTLCFRTTYLPVTPEFSVINTNRWPCRHEILFHLIINCMKYSPLFL